MMTAPSVTRANQRPAYVHGQEGEALRLAALTLLQSSAYTALRCLQCEVTEGLLIVHGVVPSYYLKQMVQTIVQRLDGFQGVLNLVEVREFSDVALADSVEVQ